MDIQGEILLFPIPDHNSHTQLGGTDDISYGSISCQGLTLDQKLRSSCSLSYPTAPAHCSWSWAVGGTLESSRVQRMSASIKVILKDLWCSTRRNETLSTSFSSWTRVQQEIRRQSSEKSLGWLCRSDTVCKPGATLDSHWFFFSTTRTYRQSRAS